MKKFISIFVLFLVASISYSQVKVEIETKKAMPNTNVQVGIILKDNPNNLITNIGQLFIDYDENLLEPLTFTGFNSAIPITKWVYNLNLGCPNVRLCPIALNWLDCDEALPNGSTFFVIEFKYKGGADAYVRWSTNVKESEMFEPGGLNKIQTEWIDGKVEPAVKYDMELSPNPLLSESIIHLKFKFDLSASTKIKLIDMTGKVLEEKSIGIVTPGIYYYTDFNVDKPQGGVEGHAPNGAYIVLVENELGSVPLKFTIAR